MENTFMYKVFKENVLVDCKKHIWKVYFEEDVKINYRHFFITLLQQINESSWCSQTISDICFLHIFYKNEK